MMLFGAASWLLLLSFYIYEGFQTKNWPFTEGVIISATAQRIDHDKERYIIDVNYEYKLAGKAFNGHNISGTKVMYTRSEINKELENYVPDTKVHVFYQPSSPKNAYLKTGIDNGLYILWLAAVGMCIFSIIKLRKLYK